MVHALGRRIKRSETFLVVLKLVQADRQIEFAEACIQFLVCIDLFGLSFIETDRTTHTAQVVFDTFHVHLHTFELAARFLALLFVLAHAGGFFKEHSAIIGLIRKHRLNHVGVHLRIRTRTQARVKEQGVNITQTAFLVIDEVFARTVAVHTARHNDFGIIRSKCAIAIIDDNRNFGKTHGGTFFSTAKDNVLHLAHTQSGGFLFAKHPADGVRNIGLATAVRPNDSRKTLRREVNFRPLREGFKTKNL